MKKKPKEKQVIGRKDKIDLLKMRLSDIDAKIDTGAYTSAIHCHNIKIVEKSGKKYVSFNLLDPSHPKYNEKRYRMQLHSKKKIKNSFGNSEERCIVQTYITIFGKKYEIEFSLSDRSKMDYPVLLGRKLLKKGFVVDVSKSNLSYKQKVKRRKK